MCVPSHLVLTRLTLAFAEPLSHNTSVDAIDLSLFSSWDDILATSLATSVNMSIDIGNRLSRPLRDRRPSSRLAADNDVATVVTVPLGP